MLKTNENLQACKRNNQKGKLLKKRILTNFYLECEHFVLQLSLVYKRSNFFWIGKGDYEDLQISKYFGDHDRALTK